MTAVNSSNKSPRRRPGGGSSASQVKLTRSRGLALRKGGTLELVGRTEAAVIVGVARTNLTTLKDFPEPVVDYLHAGRLWLRRDVERFAQRREAALGAKS